MAITNHERVGKALDLLRDGLAPFVEREFRANKEAALQAPSATWSATASIPAAAREWDAAVLLR